MLHVSFKSFNFGRGLIQAMPKVHSIYVTFHMIKHILDEFRVKNAAFSLIIVFLYYINNRFFLGNQTCVSAICNLDKTT